jgi:hypothetical protein
VPAERRAPARPRRLWALHAVGGLLLVAELATSGLHLRGVVPQRYLPLRALTVELLSRYQAHRLVWPFDSYPFFTTDGPAEVSLLDPRLVEASGRERRVPPAAFEAAVGRSSASAVIVRRLARLRDPGARQTASRHLAEALWRQLTPEERRGAQGLRMYVSRVRVSADLGEPLERALLLEIPASTLDTKRLAHRE